MTLGRGFRGHQLLGLLARDGLKIVFSENVVMAACPGCRGRRGRGLGKLVQHSRQRVSPEQVEVSQESRD